MTTAFRARAVALLAPAVVALVGCGQQAPKSEPAAVAEKKGEKAKKEDDHSDWWCAEQGIPEEECSMCSSKVAKAFKDKGDWCQEHDRAKSQCFVCDPSLKEKFAAKYRAKYGQEPPEPEAEKDGKGGS
ncbi:MAG: hypothetical protein K2X87_10170 [Gemmataceae bacterium]|nr:hypothetical protein [Gemmataceae bacterium]